MNSCLNKVKVILHVKDFTITPTGRYGKDSASEFFNNCFVNTYLNNQEMCLNMDGTTGYGSAFLEELTFNIVRFLTHLGHDLRLEKYWETIISDEDPSIILELEEYFKSEIAKVKK